MRRPPVETIRRLALLGVVVMTLIVAGSYGLRRWRAQQARSALPAAVPTDVEQQAETFTFSRSEEGQTLFTVTASRTTEWAGQTTLLEDVRVRIFGRQGDRTDEVRATRCEYDAKQSERIVCAGEVTVALRRSQEADASVAPAIQLTTTALHFNPREGVAWTEEPVDFSFPGGTGEAVGLRYQPREPRVRFEKNISILVSRGPEEPAHIDGSRLDYNATQRVFNLAPPLRVRVSDRTLAADRLRMELDPEFETKRIQAMGNVRVTARQDGRELTMRADRAVANYAAGGGIEEVQAHGKVDFRGQGPQSEERLTCRNAVFFFQRPLGVLKRVVATGGPQLVVETPTETRSLRAPRLELMLPVDATGRQILTGSQRGTLDVRQKSGEQRSVTGNRLRVEFAEGQLQAIDASGEVETHESRPGGKRRTTRSEELRSRFESGGALAAAQQWGTFRYDDGRWQAAAGRAEYAQTRGTVVLTEKPVLWDESSRTRARVIEVVENSGNLRAQGGVRTTRRGAAGDSDGFGTGEPVQLAAERLYVWPEDGRARYEGQARLWQGENRLAAETIELFGEPERLTAEGEVSALFFDAPAEGKQEERRPVRVTSERFHYQAAERRAVFSGSVVARNDFGTLAAPRLQAFLTGGTGSGAGRLERVRAHGDVRLEQGGYKATSEQGEYRADTQTVVLWGGTPTIHHPERGTTTGARLTLFLADDTLSVDSAEESRTVTRRPWAQ